ncbi:MAG: hypothetical protein RL603_2021 [Pseudomonadota bacterium]|jgi:hypothetical protein
MKPETKEVVVFLGAGILALLVFAGPKLYWLVMR